MIAGCEKKADTWQWRDQTRKDIQKRQQAKSECRINRSICDNKKMENDLK
jgi:hypothetical protein